MASWPSPDGASKAGFVGGERENRTKWGRGGEEVMRAKGGSLAVFSRTVDIIRVGGASEL